MSFEFLVCGLTKDEFIRIPNNIWARFINIDGWFLVIKWTKPEKMLEALIKIYVDVVYESVVYKSDFYQPGRIDSSIYYNIARYCGVGMKK